MGFRISVPGFLEKSELGSGAVRNQNNTWKLGGGGGG